MYACAASFCFIYRALHFNVLPPYCIPLYKVNVDPRKKERLRRVCVLFCAAADADAVVGKSVINVFYFIRINRLPGGFIER